MKVYLPMLPFQRIEDDTIQGGSCFTIMALRCFIRGAMRNKTPSLPEWYVLKIQASMIPMHTIPYHSSKYFIIAYDCGALLSFIKGVW